MAVGIFQPADDGSKPPNGGAEVEIPSKTPPGGFGAEGTWGRITGGRTAPKRGRDTIARRTQRGDPPSGGKRGKG